MDAHALEILEEAKSWDWPVAKRIQEQGDKGVKYNALTPQLLSCLIKESQALGGTVLDQFWEQVGNCHPKLKENVGNLTSAPPGQATAILFEGVNRHDVDLKPVFQMGAEYFTHLCVAIMNPGGSGSGTGSSCSVTELVAMETDDLLALAREEGFGQRKQEALKRLAKRRDGTSCVVTGLPLKELPTDRRKYTPILAHIIPNSLHSKPDTLKCLAMFAGKTARDLVFENPNGIGNVMNLEMNAHFHYNNLQWGIEARDEGGKIKYIFRNVPYSPGPGPASINLQDGDEIHFGGGEEGEKLGQGPLPLLCNVQLAVARVLHMSGAAKPRTIFATF